MRDIQHSGVREVKAADTDGAFISRVRVALGLMLASSTLFPLLEVVFRTRALPSLHIILLQVILVAVVWLRLSRGEGQATSDTVLLVTAVAIATAAVGVATGNDTMAPLLFVVLTMVAATLIPWGAAAQLTIAVVAGLALLGNIVAVRGSLAAFGYPTAAAVGCAFVASVYIAYELQRSRSSEAEHDVDRQRTEAALQLVESAVEQTKDAIVIITPELNWPGPRIVYVNPAFSEMTGHAAKVAVGQTLQLLFGPGTHSSVIHQLHTALSKPRPSIGQGVFHRKDGIAYTLEWHTAPVRDGGGLLTHWVMIGRDITERRRAEEEKAALLEVARDISGRLDLSEILDRVQQRIAALLPCDRVTTFAWDTAAGLLRLTAHYGFPSDGTLEVLPAEFQPSPALLELLTSGQVVIVNDIYRQSWLPAELLARLRLSTMLAAPLLVRGRMVGALLAGSTSTASRFDTGQVQLFEAIADQVAVTIEAAELYRSQQQEANASRALAQVGEVMISSLDTPVLLSRLCQLTTQLLECDCSHIFLWKREEGAYLPVSSFGEAPEQWESMRLLRIPPEVVAGPLARLERDTVAQLKATAEDDPFVQLLARYGLSTTLCVALRRGDELVGFHAAHYRDRVEPFSYQQQRIARGIAHLASMGLENARLVEELEGASRIKSDFVASMSHELRTPLNVMIGYTDLLLEGEFGSLNDEQVDALQRTDKSARELRDMINATLDMSRLDPRRVVLEVQVFSVADLVEEVRHEARGLTDKPELTLRCVVEPDLPLLRSDRLKVKMVLKNLLDNSIKFTEQGSVSLAASRSDGGVEFTVRDTGIGIAPDAHGVIFEPFRQVDSSPTRSYGGVGLGLYIVQRLLGMLGGTITVESELGVGATFRVWLPSDVKELTSPPPLPRR